MDETKKIVREAMKIVSPDVLEPKIIRDLRKEYEYLTGYKKGDLNYWIVEELIIQKLKEKNGIQKKSQ